MWGNWNLIGETRAQPLNDAHGRMIVRVAGDGHGLINGANEGRNSATSLERIAMPAKRLKNLKSNMPHGNSNMFSVADFKIDVTDIGAIRYQNTEVIHWNKIT
jgi:hypothetical protein